MDGEIKLADLSLRVRVVYRCEKMDWLANPKKNKQNVYLSFTKKTDQLSSIFILFTCNEPT